MLCLCQSDVSEEKKFVEGRAEKEPTCIQLGTKKFVMTESQRSFTVDVGKVREGRAYEIGIVLENQTTVAFQTSGAKTSCSCLVGSIKDSEIGPGKTGLLFLKFGVKKGVNHQAVIESRGGKPIELNVNGEVVPDLIVVPGEIEVKSLSAGLEFRIQLEPQFKDLIPESVVFDSYSGDCKVTKSEIVNGSVFVDLMLGRSLKTDLFTDTIRVKYRIEGEEKIRERDIVIRVRSRDVVVRPKIVSLERAASPDGSVILRGNMTLYNVPESFRPKPQKFKVRIGNDDLEFEASLIEFSVQKLSSRCFFEICMSQEEFQAIGFGLDGAISSSKRWPRFSFLLDGVELSGLNCILLGGVR